MSTTPDRTLDDPQQTIADLQRQLAESNAERDEALGREAASAEVLQVINSSPGDLSPVFDAMVERAKRLCGAANAALFTPFDGELFHLVAVAGEPQLLEQAQSFGPIPSTNAMQGRLAKGEDLVHIADVRETDLYRESPILRERVGLLGLRTWLGVALRKEDVLLGTIAVSRKEVRPFSEREIALLQNFAAQAVIAMENARLITETREALEQQTATAEVLQVINASPGDLAPVFEAMLEKATRLCEAPFGILRTWDGERFHFGAVHGDPRFSDWVRQRGPFRPNRDESLLGRILAGERVVHFSDAAGDEGYRTDAGFRKMAEASGIRSAITVALHMDDALLGTITVYRQEVRPFTDKQIALLQNFAAQAVIAMENARLITETREALEQQTATAEVLQVINSSPGELEPVFDTMLEKAIRLCEAAHGHFLTYDGEAFHPTAVRGKPGFEEFWRRGGPVRPSHPSNPLAQLARGARLVHVADAREEEAYREVPDYRSVIDLGGIRTSLTIPLRKEGTLLGAVRVYRQEVRPFTEKQIALLENFAAQAVIAMENARLITETREALEQQTATAEVLQVINSSPGDLAPVFDAMLEKAIRLCEATHGRLFTYDGESFYLSADRSNARYIEWAREAGPVRPYPTTPLGRLARGDRIVHVADIREDEGYRAVPRFRESVELRGVRSQIAVALLKDNVLLGAMYVYRQEVRPFSDKQVALLENFAAQAVIAMENARLITETREALEQQTATAEVLQVINSSPGDLAPVFDAMLDKAMHLCGAAFGVLQTYDGREIRIAATRGVPAAFAEFRRNNPPAYGPGTGPARILAGERVVHIADLKEEDAYRSGDSNRRAIVDLGGARTALLVALVKDDDVLGFIMIYRQEVRPFSDKQIALLQNFAAQAVIAMENARLITETREALEQQTATADVLQVINASPGNLTPVFDAMLEKATVLCAAAHGNLWTYDGERFHPVATHGSPGFAQWLSQSGAVSPAPGSLFERMVRGERFVQIADAANDNPYLTSSWSREVVDITGARTVLVVPLRKDRALLGAIFSYRQEVRPFTDKEIALLENFAAQAVVAMENARLITETREALEQQTATAEVLQVINSSPGDLTPVFAAMLDKAMRLCTAAFGYLMTYDGERFQEVAHQGLPPAFAEYLPRMHQPGPSGMYAGILRGSPFVQVNDLSEGEVYRTYPLRQALVDLGGARTGIGVALRKDDALLGVITIYRQEVRPYSENEIALLQSFAAQAVIAMENARLLDEIRQRQAELRVTFDNMADGVAMFDEDLRLAAWNRNFQEILDLPDALLAERPRYSDYLRILAERGEFGTDDIEAELSRRLDNTDQELRLERTRPDGRVIEVRRNAVPDGGFVLIYSDITERKRSEAEIRAARDAAEAAYRDLKAAQASLIQAEKMASLGQLTAGIAHEIKNPLNFVNNFAGLSVELLDELKETTAPAVAALGHDKRAEVDETIEMLTGNLEKIAEHGRRADNIVKSMLEHSRGSSGERRSVDLNGLIEEALNLAYHGARAQDQSFNITLERDFAEGIAPIELVPQDITRVCLNLIGNGFYAATKRQKVGSDPKFKPTLKVTTRDLGDVVEIRVHDNGTGISPEIKDKLFQPFFTTKPTGEGTGLGLSISYDIITQQHGGTITVDSKVGEFTEFTVLLPRAYGATMPEAAS